VERELKMQTPFALAHWTARFSRAILDASPGAG
jgi:hypothetical protein